MEDEEIQNDPVIDQLEAEPIETPENPIVDFLKSLEDQDLVSAEKQFNDMVGDRLQDTLDQARAKIASSIYGDDEVAAAQAEVESDLEEYEFGVDLEDPDLEDEEDEDL